jgi:predicted unusual protein kinase regulating ubiquinone biosynthesis (AarF/ABC1/UbiB family)
VRGLLPDLGRTDARALAREVGERIGEEIDYRKEAASQTEIGTAFAGHPFIRIPAILPELSADRVLTMERSTGMRWSQAQHADQELKDLWGEAIYRFTLGSLRRLGTFNADPHPGNYLFHDDGSVTFLDFGCVKRFSMEQVGWMTQTVQKAIDGDGEGLLKQYAAQGFLDPDDPPTAEGLLAWAQQSLRPALSAEPFRYTPEYAATIVDGVFSPRGQHAPTVQKLTLPGEYLTLTRIDLGMTSVLAALRAETDWKGIREELDCDGPPSTRYGELEQAWLRRDAA